MRTCVVVVAMVAVMAASCAGPSTTPPGSRQPTSGAPSAAPSGTSLTPLGPWRDLSWEDVELPALPANPSMTSIASSERGLLVRVLQRPDSQTVSLFITRDGRSWTTGTAPSADAPFGYAVNGTGEWLQLVFGDTGDSGVDLLASSDGASWRLRGHLPDAILRAGTLQAVKDGTFVVCGPQRDMSVSVETCAVSPDEGATWRHLPELDPVIGSGQFLGVTATTRGFLLAVSKDVGGTIVGGGATSVDGITWATLPHAPGLQALAPDIFPRIASFGSVHLLVGSVLEGREYIHGLWLTSDGRRWERVGLPSVPGWRGTLSVTDDGVVALVSDGRGDDMRLQGAFVSGDGRTWRAVDLPAGLTDALEWEWSVVPVGDALLFFRQEGGRAMLARAVPTADPGPTPAPAPTAPPVPSGSAAPAIAWQAGAIQPVGHAADVVAWNGVLIAGGHTDNEEEGFRPAVWSSADGLTWQPAPAPAAEHTRITALAADGEWLLAAGLTFKPNVTDDRSLVATFWRSHDGRTWERVAERPDFVIGLDLTDGAETGLFDLAVGGPGWVAVGGIRDGGATIWTSSDGTDWRRAATLGTGVIYGIAPTEYGFVAVGATGGPNSEGRVWTSSDGARWTRVTGLPTGQITSIASRGPALVGGGWGPTVWRSVDGEAWEAVPDQPALRRRTSEEAIATVVAPSWGFVAAGGVTCPTSIDACPAAFSSADGWRWVRTLLSGQEAARMLPLASVVNGDEVVLVGAYDLRTLQQGWRSWVGMPGS